MSTASPTATEPKRPNDRGYTHFCIDVTDMETDIEHLKKCGMTFNDREFVDVGHVKGVPVERSERRDIGRPYGSPAPAPSLGCQRSNVRAAS